MPFDCNCHPAVSQYRNNGQSIAMVIAHDKNYCIFNVYTRYVESNIERIIWIGFYKNDKNDKCLIKNLPKDLVIYLLFLLGKQEMVKPYIKI